MAQSTTTHFMCKYLPALMISAGLSIAYASGPTLEVDNIRAPGGTLYMAIYAATTGGSWQDEPVLRLQNSVADASSTLFEVALPDGHYAARAFLDRNQNGQLDLDASGKPLEPFAISIGSHRKKPSIKFHESVFVFSPQQSHIRLTLRYPKAKAQPSTDS